MYYNFFDPRNLTDEELVRFVQSGNESAFAELVTRYSPRIWHIVVENSRQRRDAEEILDDIWLAVWENIIGLRKPESFSGWLRRIAYSTCNRYYASNLHRNKEIVLSYEDLTVQIDREADQRFQNANIRADVREAVHHLPTKVRPIAVLYYLELWNIGEIADEMDLAVGTIKTRLSEVRQLLRKQFNVDSQPNRRGNMSIETKAPENIQTQIKVIGVGGAGCNVVNQLRVEDYEGIEFCVVDSDIETLNTCSKAQQVQIGVNTLQGKSTDGNLSIGRRAFGESIEALESMVLDAKMVFVIAGMGGGIGTSVAPKIASLAKKQGTLTISIVTRPFDSEGTQHAEQAEKGLRELQNRSRVCTDAVLVVPNQRVLEMFNGTLPSREVYHASNEYIHEAIKIVTDSFIHYGEISLDFDDIQKAMRDQGTIRMGTGKAKGKNKFIVAAQNAINSPLLEEKVAGAAHMIISFKLHRNFSNKVEISEAMDILSQGVKETIFFGVHYDDSKENDEVIASFLAIGVDHLKDKDTLSPSMDKETYPDHPEVISPSTTSEFVHLHNHSEYSFLDGACRIADMVDWTIENNSAAVALTDKGNMFGAWEFYNTAKTNGLNPIVGCEVYVKNKKDGELYHLTLLAEDAVGYRNLLELTSIGYTHGFNRKPSISLEILREYHTGIIALTGCINGIVPKLIYSGKREEAVKNLLELKDIMGEDNLFIEIQNHYLDKELTAYPLMVDLAKEYNLPIVGTNDCHYLRKSDYRMHEILQCIRTKKTINDLDRVQLNNHFYFKDVNEMQQALNDYPPEALYNSVEIANRCNLNLDYGNSVTPVYDVPDGLTADSYLREQCYNGLHKKVGGHLSEVIRERLEYELGVIQQSGYANYFLIVSDYVNYANKQGYLYTARGSASSSLVLYALDVLNFNPMDHGCLFERFLNLDRMNLPDIDIDFADNVRDDVIDYLIRKYGHDSVGRIAVFSTLGTKAAIKDVGRALEIPIENIEALTKLIPNRPGVTLEETVDQVQEFKELATLPENSELIEISKSIIGMKRHVSCHASAIAISKGPLSSFVPLFKDKHGQIATQFEGKTVENVGIIKLDTLGVRSLSEIAECINMIQENHDQKIAMEHIPLNDKKTFSLISEGLIAGLFQLETSQGMYKVVTDLKADNFDEFSAIPALYRPGPIESGVMQEFIDRKNGVRAIQYMHPSLENALNDTYGVCIYQEQIMKITCDVAGYTLNEADILRSALGKRDVGILDEQRAKFINGAVENGINSEEAEKIYEYVVTVGSYAFNKSHSVAYAMLSYRMAYLKTHYPHEFMASIMSGESNDKEKIKRYQVECAKLGEFLNVNINLLPLDINISEKNFVVDGNDIRFGFVVLKGISNEDINSILTERNHGGLFTSIQDFHNRMVSIGLNEDVIDEIIVSDAIGTL